VIGMPSVASGNLIRSILFVAFAGPLLGVVLSSTATKADFFNELFGFDQAPTQPRTYQYLPRTNARRQIGRKRTNDAYLPAYRHERLRKANIAPIPRKADQREETSRNETATGSRPVKPAICARENTVKKMSRLSQLLSDSTLRSGDIIVTEAGIRVFRGDGTCPHKHTDFVALTSADLPRGQLRVLASLEVAMRAPHGRDQHR
jgi:hypothetical protein